MKKIAFTMFLVVLFPSFALAYDVLLWGKGGELPPLEENVALLGDLGGHEFPPDTWERFLPSPERTVILPTSEDLEKRREELKTLANKGYPVVVSDASGTYLPLFSFTRNYHTITFFNFTSTSSSSPFGEYLKELEETNPDLIVVIGTEQNRAFLEKQFSPFAPRMRFITRDTLPKNFTETVTVEEKPVFLFFYSSRCPVCRELKEKVTPPVFERYAGKIKVVYLDYTFSKNYEKLVLLEEQWKVQEKTSVEIFSDAGYVATEDPERINVLLEQLIEKTLRAPKPTQAPRSLGEAKELIFSRFRGFTPWVIAGAGFLDGLNPCAFATIVFMVNLLFVLGHSRQRIVEIGITYTVAVFVTYLLLGLGIFEVWQTLGAYRIVSRIVYGAMALLLLVFATLSVRDAIAYWRERKETGMTLGLPKGLRVKINQYLKESFSKRRLFAAAVASGFAVSILEAGCTGQVYLPTIMYIAKEAAEYRLKAFGYLAFYNAFFIIPLVAVFLSVFFGSQSKALVEFGRKNILISKVAISALFVVLSILLIESALA
ncbi:MAG: thioredoxin domain-containing protein [Candidatus Caldatribacterium sp.]|uniref:thioredoxin domain-containing protein n=1 Tax=Candidatus Caldatribacterium sp. TaxID=2282143 RepID=UPI00299175BF|nr:thioredoxin domain-containing protein [Candidatus Caldatribacterium sp.]MCX7730139.1 thioredoxin domain-containing protein [Candidatus Caldatribacterium sp.]MDW8081968.1 thioredoxin domain-containing protein [Candidatus Calescibacterium sp.]